MTEQTIPNQAAIDHFAARLSFETDPSDVHAAMAAGERLVVVDVRGDAAWAQGRIPGAIHLRRDMIATRAVAEVPRDMPVVAYCWGPACNAATKAALEFGRLGYQVKEMIGGFEYWAREGLAVEDDLGPISREPDPLTSPVPTHELAAARDGSAAQHRHTPRGYAVSCDC